MLLPGIGELLVLAVAKGGEGALHALRGVGDAPVVPALVAPLLALGIVGEGGVLAAAPRLAVHLGALALLVAFEVATVLALELARLLRPDHGDDSVQRPGVYVEKLV